MGKGQNLEVSKYGIRNISTSISGKNSRHEEKGAPPNTLAATLQKYQKESGRSIYQLSNTIGVDAAYIWRIMHGERQQVSWEIPLLGIALALDASEVDNIIEITNNLLDAAGFKKLR